MSDIAIVGEIQPPIDITSGAFALRLANVLGDCRRRSGCSQRALARRSGGAFTRRDLRAVERAAMPLDEAVISALGELYDADLDEICCQRRNVSISSHGVISTGGISTSFTPHDSASLLSNYLRLVRRLRGDEATRSIELRRHDIEAIADYLGESGESVVERLGALMGSTQVQRRAMVGTFTAGALVIGLATSSASASAAGAAPTGDLNAAAMSAAVSTMVPTGPIWGMSVPSLTVGPAGD